MEELIVHIGEGKSDERIQITSHDIELVVGGIP
jgi:hypothetical protein